MAREEGFTLVKRRSKHVATRKHQNLSTASSGELDHGSLDIPLLLQAIAVCREQLRETQFQDTITTLLATHLIEPRLSVIVCYGIGHIGTCHIARHQFAFLLEAVRLYKPHTTRLYDPILLEDEQTAIKECGCQIDTENEQCKFSVEENTLFFMPHCGKAMYNNLLWANWSADRLRKIAIIGNSFDGYHERLTEKQFLEEAPYVYHIHRHGQEIPFPPNHPDSTVFNDTSLHLFPREGLEGIDAAVWEDCLEPSVNPLDPEIIT